ncbi:hypothetical protein BESB_079160 [Besnoitia besnoiti]|uniref:Uncharacterized protein n=1 Tax=Besnoitia besnoiti TaxID=94643 RepID=A0A2A9ME90_BESBE|nr:hypothetical protein BESB_079160 [Besnoitia besnoiti]PFH33700.1 hypothetical protein BESB_079160 [Besnoitia besnoiti]
MEPLRLAACQRPQPGAVRSWCRRQVFPSVLHAVSVPSSPGVPCSSLLDASARRALSFSASPPVCSPSFSFFSSPARPFPCPCAFSPRVSRVSPARAASSSASLPYLRRHRVAGAFASRTPTAEARERSHSPSSVFPLRRRTSPRRTTHRSEAPGPLSWSSPRAPSLEAASSVSRSSWRRVSPAPSPSAFSSVPRETAVESGAGSSTRFPRLFSTIREEAFEAAEARDEATLTENGAESRSAAEPEGLAAARAEGWREDNAARVGEPQAPHASERAAGENEDVMARAWHSLTQGKALGEDKLLLCAAEIERRTKNIVASFSGFFEEAQQAQAERRDEQDSGREDTVAGRRASQELSTDGEEKGRHEEDSKKNEEIRRCMQDLASFFFLSSALKLTSLNLRECLYTAASLAASLARLSAPSASSPSARRRRERRLSSSQVISRETETPSSLASGFSSSSALESLRAAPPCAADSPSLSPPESRPPSSSSSSSSSEPTSSPSSSRVPSISLGWRVAADDAALLLRCIGSEGRGGTHTVPYVSALISRALKTPTSCTIAQRKSSASPPSSSDALASATSVESSSALSPLAGASLSEAGAEGEQGRRRPRAEINEKEILDALVEALVGWTRASMMTAPALTNALQGYAWNAVRRGACRVEPHKVRTFLRPLEQGGSVFFSPQQLSEVLEALLLLNCRALPRVSDVVESLTVELLRTNQSSTSLTAAREADSRARGGLAKRGVFLPSCSLSPQQLVLWLVVLTKYRVESDEAFEVVAEVLQQPDVVRTQFSPALIAGLAYAFGKFLGASQQVALETLAAAARQKLHLFSLGDLSQLLVSLTRAGIVERVLFARSAVLVRRSLSLSASTPALPSVAPPSGPPKSARDSRAATPCLSGCADASPEQVVNLCVMFARQKLGDERLFRSLGELMFSQPPSWMISTLLNENPDAHLPETRLECLNAADIVSLVVAFAQVRSVHRALFEAADELLLSRVQQENGLSPLLTLRLLQAHAKLGYRSLDLQHCLLLSLAIHVTASSTRLSVAELLQLVEATDALGLTLPPRLRESVNRELPPELRNKGAASEEGESDDEEFAKMWRGMRVGDNGKRKKRQKARKRKWTW